jgi:hypothetical protein
MLRSIANSAVRRATSTTRNITAKSAALQVLPRFAATTNAGGMLPGTATLRAVAAKGTTKNTLRSHTKASSSKKAVPIKALPAKATTLKKAKFGMKDKKPRTIVRKAKVAKDAARKPKKNTEAKPVQSK